MERVSGFYVLSVLLNQFLKKEVWEDGYPITIIANVFLALHILPTIL